MPRQKLVNGELIDLTPEEEAARDAEEAAEAARLVSEEYQTELDDQYLIAQFPPRQLIKLLYQITGAIPAQSRTTFINQFRQKVENVRRERTGA